MFSYLRYVLRAKLGNQKGVTMVEYVLVLLFVVAVAGIVFAKGTETGLGKALQDGINKVAAALSSK